MRSMLFVPGDRPERFSKAVTSGADAVILDLEDAVAPAQRPKAREAIGAFLASSSRTLPLWVRINPVQSGEALADLTAVVAGRPDGIVLPKARSGADVLQLDHWLQALEATHGHPSGGIRVIPMVTETAGEAPAPEDMASVSLADSVIGVTFADRTPRRLPVLKDVHPTQ